jgi:outer membrane protein OmpA-like peptidoglycan-associated protein
MSQQTQLAVQTQQKATDISSIKRNMFQRAAINTTITSVHNGILQRCSGGVECEECRQKRLEKEGMLQRAAVNSAPANGIPPIVHDVIGSSGQPLDGGTRAFMEPRFGHDFSRVRVHTDDRAAESARAVNALAYTIGRDVVFGEGQYAPEASEGRRLLAHELTHVVQQNSSPVNPGANIVIGTSGTVLEREAEANTESVIARKPMNIGSLSSGGVLQRQGPSGSEAPIERERRVNPRINLDPDSIELALEIIRGQHRITGEANLLRPINLFGVSIPGLDPAQFNASLGYENRCNRAFQSALLSLQQDQRRGGAVIDFHNNPWQVGTKVGFRMGTVSIEPGGTISFVGDSFDSAIFTLTIATGVSSEIPRECIPVPSPARPPTPPESPEKGQRPDIPESTRPTEERGSKGTTPHLPNLTLYFFYDTPILRPESNGTLHQIVNVLQTIPTIHVHLTGHTSLEGTDEYNLRLSQRRARAMQDYLVIAGIAASRIQTLGLGEFAPAVPEPPEQQHVPLPSVERIRDLNRRVEVVFFDPTGTYAPVMPPFTLQTTDFGRPSRSPAERHSLGLPELQFSQ